MSSLNEKGSALLTVILTVTLLFIFGAVLATSTINGIKQTKLSERDIQAAHLAEMGIEHFRKSPEETLASIGPFFVAGKDAANTDGKAYSYQYENVTRNEGTGRFSFTSVGKSFGKEKRIDVAGVFYDGNTSPCDGPYGPDCYLESDRTVNHTVITEGDMSICNKTNIEITDGSLYTGGTLYLTHNAGGKNSSSITIEKDGYFSEGLSMLQQNSLIVKGDAYFFNTDIDLTGDKININDCPPPIEEDEKDNNRNRNGDNGGIALDFVNQVNSFLTVNRASAAGNTGLLCVEGTLFYPEDQSIPSDVVTNNLSASETCGSLTPNNEKGIWAREYQAIPRSSFPEIFKGFPIIMVEQVNYQ